MKKKDSKENNFLNMYIIFVLFSFLGVIYEEIIALIKYFYRHKTLMWRRRWGVIYGPFNPLYGGAVVLIILLLGKKKQSYKKTFLEGALLGGSIEFIISLLMELVLGVRSWDYTNRPLNIMGRTTLLYMGVWGILIMVLIHFVYPFLVKLLDKMNFKLKKIIGYFLVIFMTLNMLVSFTALGRQALRNKGYPPFTVIGEFYDKVYPDEVLKKAYQNMKFVR